MGLLIDSANIGVNIEANVQSIFTLGSCNDDTVSLYPSFHCHND